MVCKIAAKGQHPERRPAKLISRVSLCRLDVAKRVPSHRCQKVNAILEDQGTQRRRQQVTEDEFKRVCVLPCDCYGNFVFVVDLVHIFVECACVQHSVAHVESKIFNKHAEDNLAAHFPGVRDTLKSEVKFEWQVEKVERSVCQRCQEK